MLADQTAHVQPMLAEYCRTRDVALRNALAEHYLYMAEMVARRFSGRGVDYDDLFQVASIALLRALERYDCEKGIQFVTFASPTLVGEVRNYFRDKGRVVRLPRRGGELYLQIRKAREQLAQDLGRERTIEDMAAHLNVHEDDIIDAIEMQQATQALSLDAPAQGEEDQMPLSTAVGLVDGAFERVENRDLMHRTLAQLPPQERKLVLLRIVREQSQREVAQEMGVSQMQISRMERKIYAKLRDQLDGGEGGT